MKRYVGSVYKLFSIRHSIMLIQNNNYEYIYNIKLIRKPQNFYELNIKSRILLSYIYPLFTDIYQLVIETKEGRLAHINHLIRACWKFPFAEKNSYIIGPAYTIPSFRRKGLYKLSLSTLVSFALSELNSHTVYIFSEKNNFASLKCIEMLGFKFVGFIKKDVFGRYNSI